MLKCARMEPKGKILLHTCCGVCASHCAAVLREDGWEPVLFYSNHNIYPHDEWLRRREAVRRLAAEYRMEFVEDPPDHAIWRAEVAAGYEACKEGGARCARCFAFSLRRACAAMKKLGCAAFTTSLTVSPHKRSAVLHAIGRDIGGDAFIPYDFKKKNGFLDSNRRAAELGLYRQTYCGCEFSMRHREPFAAVILGMGYRGRVYAAWAEAHPEDLIVVAFAEPDPAVRAEWQARLGCAAYADWEEALQTEDAECAVIALPDRLHFEAAASAIHRSLHLLLEKPVAATWDECVELDGLIRESGSLVQVGYILRHTPYYRKIREILLSGQLGEPVSVTHLEPVSYWKAALAFCRGTWGNTARSTPMILQKCCHDFDLFSWWTGRRCLSVQSFGSLIHFRPDCAPPGAAAYCKDCAPETERNCPYSALKLMEHRSEMLYMLPDSSPEAVAALEEGPLGRCVYACDNDAVDHQTVNLLFEGGLTVSHSMEAYTYDRDRQTRIFCTRGEIIGDSRTLRIRDFATRSETLWNAAQEIGIASQESAYVSGNEGIMQDWVDAMRGLPKSLYADWFHSAVQSHAIAFAAECSRAAGGMPIPVATL